MSELAILGCFGLAVCSCFIMVVIQTTKEQRERREELKALSERVKGLCGHTGYRHMAVLSALKCCGESSCTCMTFVSREPGS